MLELLDQLNSGFTPISLALPRILLTLWLLPFLSESFFDGKVRSIFAFCLALGAFPIIRPEIPPEGFSILMILGLLIKEALIGLLLGFLNALPFWIAVTMAFMVDTQRGATMAGLFSPVFTDQASPLGLVMTQAMAVLFFVSGGFLIMLQVIYQSYTVWPVTQFIPNMTMATGEYLINQFQAHMYTAVLLAAPLVIILFVIDLSMGLINRFVPQLQVFFLSLPIKATTAIFILFIYMGSLLGFLETEFLRLSEKFNFLQGVL